MNPEQKEKLWELIKEYGEDCDYLAGRECEGSGSEIEEAKKFKTQSLERLIALIEEL